MSLSIFLTIYFLFLVTYAALLGFAVYKVFLFAKNRDLKGHSRRITLLFLITVSFIVFVSFLLIPRFHWDDNLSFYCKKVSKSCSCEIESAKKEACLAAEKINQSSDSASSSATKADNAAPKKYIDPIHPDHYLFIN